MSMASGENAFGKGHIENFYMALISGVKQWC